MKGREAYPDEELRRRIMDFIMVAGQTLLENGAEVFRVEQTMEIMARSFHLREFHVYVLTNGIFASAGTAEISEVRNVPVRTTHLGRVAAVNALSREIAESRARAAPRPRPEAPRRLPACRAAARKSHPRRAPLPRIPPASVPRATRCPSPHTASKHLEWPLPTTFHVPVQAYSLLVPNWVPVSIAFFELLDITQARCRTSKRKALRKHLVGPLRCSVSASCSVRKV